MASTVDDWVIETIGDFIHSSIWKAPVNTFIEAHCASFDFDDDEDPAAENDNAPPTSSLDEKMNIHRKYQCLIDSLIESLGKDLDLDQNVLKKVCEYPAGDGASRIIDEQFEQLYAAREFSLFQEMMKRKNLILQLQALVTLQLQWGILKHSETGNDLVIALLLQATSSSPVHGSFNFQTEPVEESEALENEDKQNRLEKQYDDDDDVVSQEIQRQPSPPRKRKEPSKPKKVSKEYNLPDLRLKSGEELDQKWYRDLQQKTLKKDSNDDSNENERSRQTSTPQTIGTVPEEVLREKLRELSIRTASVTGDETTAAMKSRQNFLNEQRKLIVDKQRAERARDLEQQIPTARPQSAAHIARKAMAADTTSKLIESKPSEETASISNDELNKRRALMAKLRRDVINKQ